VPTRSHSLLTLPILVLALTVAPALAEKPAPTRVPPVTAFPPEGPLGIMTSGSPACALGVTAPLANAFGYVIPPDDQYYTRIDPGSCPSCSNDLYKATVAHVQLYFSTPCEIPVTVALVPAVESEPGCWSPDPLAAPLCPPTQYMVGDGGTLEQCLDFQLPLDPACCFNGPAFLLVEFDSGSCPEAQPMFCGPASCTACTQYNFYPGADLPGDDLCTVLSPYGLAGPRMSADVECCEAPTSITPGSWGLLKTLYR